MPMSNAQRNIVFISKGTPEDDDFVMWLAPRLEAQGYKTFSDILSLEPGDRWRKEITDTLQTKAVKMLLCGRDVTLGKKGVHEEIGIAEDLAKELKDPRFIIPLRLEKYKKVFGIGELQYVNFEKGWADGLGELLDTLKTQNVPLDTSRIEINPNWEAYRRRSAVKIESATERLTSNWLRIAEIPDTIRYFQPTGAVDHQAMSVACSGYRYPLEVHQRGFFGFCSLGEINEGLENVGKFSVAYELPVMEFMQNGMESPFIRRREASNLVMSMFRKAWNALCRDKGLYEYAWSLQPGFHVTEAQIGLGKKVRWGTQGDRRSSALRNKAQGRIWQFGVSAMPAFWPLPHFKLKSRVLFAEASGDRAGTVLDDTRLQHRCRRSVCKGWRNKQWHGRLRGFLQLLSADEPFIRLPLAPSAAIKLDPMPMLFTSPVTTVLPDVLGDDDEEIDDQTITGRASQEDEDGVPG